VVSRRHFLTTSIVAPAAAAVQPRRRRAALRVAVIGAGAFGGWTALHLRRSGAEVTLVDAWGPGNARASSGGETRVIRTVYGGTRTHVALAARSLEQWREWDRWLGNGVSGQPFYRRTGVLWMTHADDSFVRQSLPWLQELELEYEDIEPTAAAKRWPQINFDGIARAFLEHEGGYLLARLACEAVAHELVRIGGTYRQAALVSVTSHADRPDVRLSDGSSLVADCYVFACGPWLGRIFPDVIGSLVQPTRQEVFYLGSPAGDGRFIEPHLPVWADLGDRLFYGIPGNLHRGFKIADDTRGPEFDPTSGDRRSSVDAERTVREFAARRFPDLRDAPVLGAEVCQYENTPDGRFIIDRHPAMPQVWIAGGGSGHGYKMGPAIGEMVSRLVIDDASPDPFFGLARFRPAGRH
jgi:glycine/D-amino acid oxidase-like deaminating enzyme